MILNKPLFLLFLFQYILGFSQNTYVPDDNFEQALIDLGHDSGPLDDYVSTTNINLLTALDIKSKNINDLTGIEDFLSLTYLQCSENNLSGLDLSQNKDLVILFCSSNKLTSLNVSQNIVLSQLICSNNFLTNVDTSTNSNLTIFNCDNNQLNTLNLTNNILLTSLFCSNNSLNTIDITTNKDLLFFACESNYLTSIDTSQNIKLKEFYCQYNLITLLNTAKNLDLERLVCGDNLLTALDITKNKKMLFFWCVRNQITNIDVTQNTLLKELFVADNLLTILDVSQNLDVTQLNCSFNLLTYLDVSQNTALTYFECVDNKLCSLDVRNNNNTKLTRFSAKWNNNLTCIFVDDLNYSNSNWSSINSPSVFIETEEECYSVNTSYLNIDSFNDVNTTDDTYILPQLNNGNYFSNPGGNGEQLTSGDVITSTQIIYIYLKDLCREGETSFKITFTIEDVVDPPKPGITIPSFFSPNNDGFKDSWKSNDPSNSIKKISVFNRYGKLLKTLSPYSNGWDGTFNGKVLGNDDYWYSIELKSGEILRGHFCLKK